MYSMWQTELHKIMRLILGRFCTVGRSGLSVCPVTCITNRSLRFWRVRSCAAGCDRLYGYSRRALRISR